MDEITVEQEQELNLFGQLSDFLREYEENEIVMTCRTAAVDYRFDKFVYMEMADFNREQQKTFVERWFADDPELAHDCWQALNQAEHRGLQDLARTPILLTLLCLNYSDTGGFPARRVELYEEALDVLLKRWDSSRKIRRDSIYHKLSLGRKRQLLSRLAYQSFVQGQFVIPKQQLAASIESFLHQVPPFEEKENIDGEAILRAIEAQHGLLVERARGLYTFGHLTFHEYFTARYIRDNLSNFLPELMKHIGDRSWKEIFLLTSSQLDNADVFFSEFHWALTREAVAKPALTEFLVWAEQQAKRDTELSERLPLVRAGYVFSALIRDYYTEYYHVVDPFKRLATDFLQCISTYDPFAIVSVILPPQAFPQKEQTHMAHEHEVFYSDPESNTAIHDALAFYVKRVSPRLAMLVLLKILLYLVNNRILVSTALIELLSSLQAELGSDLQDVPSKLGAIRDDLENNVGVWIVRHETKAIVQAIESVVISLFEEHEPSESALGHYLAGVRLYATCLTLSVVSDRQQAHQNIFASPVIV